MPAHGKPYSLYKRNKIYYVRFKLPDNSWGTAKSTGETSRNKAERWAFDYLMTGKIVLKENITLAEYADGFFSWDGDWATDKRVRGLRISKRQCYSLTYLVRNHLVPRMGSIKLVNIDRSQIKLLRNGLYNSGYSGNTINKVLSALKAILEAAEEESLIQVVPRIDRAAIRPKLKGILTLEECRKLFSFDWKSEPAHCHPPKDQFMGYVGNLVASSTGLRLGELQALTLSDIHLDEGYIFVRRSWDNFFGLNETTKTGKVRHIFIPELVKNTLKKLMDTNPDPANPESFVFYSEKTSGKPAEPVIFYRSLYTAMRRIGISEDERRRRNITFHSWRHWFNSLLINARVPIAKIQSITGHLTNEMTQHYYHLQLEEMNDVLQVQESIFLPNP